MRQESTKEPALALEVGCIIGAAVCMKKGLESDVKASFPSASKPFFSLLRKPAEQALRTAALLTCAKGCAVFSAEKTSGLGTPFPRRRLQSTMRQADHACVIASAKRIEKGAWKMEGKLACNPDSRSFFVSLPIHPNQKTGFRVGFREELFREKLSP